MTTNRIVPSFIFNIDDNKCAKLPPLDLTPFNDEQLRDLRTGLMSYTDGYICTHLKRTIPDGEDLHLPLAEVFMKALREHCNTDSVSSVLDRAGGARDYLDARRAWVKHVISHLNEMLNEQAIPTDTAQERLKLLRPFDLEKARAGEPICWADDTSLSIHFVGLTGGGDPVYESDSDLDVTTTDTLRMRPVMWVEGRPVYIGDKLWYHSISDPSDMCEGTVLGPHPFPETKGCKYARHDDPESWAPEECFTWTKPQRKILIGNRTVVAPETTAPLHGQYYFIPALQFEDKVDQFMWANDDFDQRCLERGWVFLKEEDAVATADAFIALLAF